MSRSSMQGTLYIAVSQTCKLSSCSVELSWSLCISAATPDWIGCKDSKQMHTCHKKVTVLHTYYRYSTCDGLDQPVDFLQQLWIEVATLVRQDLFGYSYPWKQDYQLLSDLSCIYGIQGYCFRPPSSIVTYHQNKPVTTATQWERSNSVHCYLLKWRVYHWQWYEWHTGLSSWDVLLALCTAMAEHSHIPEQGLASRSAAATVVQS